MGFKFLFNFNPNCRSYLSKIPSKTYLNSVIATQNNRLGIQAIGGAHLDGIYGAPHSQKFKMWHFGHSHHGRDHHHGPHLGSSKESENIFRLGLAADIGLTAGKAVTGYLSGSTAIIADAAHSLSDVVLSGIALLSFKASRVPRDKEHPYGHGKFETLGALAISGMLIITAGGIAWHAVDILLGIFTSAPELVGSSLIHEHDHHHNGHSHKIDMDHPFLALNMTILSIAIKEGLFWITKRAGEREGSGLMKANAWHHRADAVSSLVALIGVGGSILGVKFLDPLAGLVVSGMILKAGVESGYQSIMELVDAAVPQQQLDPHRQTILQVEGVQGCHRLRGRRAGSFLHLDVHIEVDPFTSVSAAHHIGEHVRHQIHKSHPEVVEVFIHIDPSISQFSPGIVDLEENSERSDKLHHSICSVRTICLDHKDVDNIVSTIFLSNFQQKMVVEHIRHHLLRNKFILEVEVSMPLDIMVRDAMLMAEEAEKEILRAASNVIQVNIQLRLSSLNHTSST